jgi:putative ABC transport system permease protein
MHRGRFLNSATEHFPAVVLGADTASVLGIDEADGSRQVWIGHQYFAVTGILDPIPLAPELDRSALVGFPIAKHLLHAPGDPIEVYVRTDPTSVPAVRAVLAQTADPASPGSAGVTNPTDALTARADATATFNGLYLALGAIALLVGAIGIANIMIITILERRTEIGLRRALGATPTNIGAQFVAEASLLSLIGGATGALLGAAATTTYATVRHWPASALVQDLAAAIAIAIAIGATAGLYPAIKAARLPPADALRTA